MGIFINSSDLANIKALAEQGNANAQYALAYVLSCSAVTDEDCDLMKSWYRKAATQGHPKGLWKVGHEYEVADPEQAVIWYRKSAEAGCANAQWWLGVKYQWGEGVEQDNEQALYWYRKAAEQDEAYACYALGKMHEAGEGVEQNWQQATYWYKRAADGHRDECHDMSSYLHDAHAFMKPGTYRLPLPDRTNPD
ncbi:MAG: hypothetical protein A3J24_07245 [Deltaproteobacteria bacterium RIFCSPLOWO2_02_FULL_53_8]|nr:MAG: hypothetical protein A3J24_07245 [Deltaproteobacteria bacterium RIFCSPLOWO2_02_FULL_53_8]